MDIDDDPIDWTVDEVVAFLCHNPQTPWSQSASQAPRPNPIQFEAALRENLITGEVLLHDVDKETLRDELGLKAIGHRSSMLMAIRYLQQRSRKYHRSKVNLAPQPDDRQHSLSSSLVTSVNPGYPQEILSQNHRNSVSLAGTPRNGVTQSANLRSPSSPTASNVRRIFPTDALIPSLLQENGSNTLAVSVNGTGHVADSSEKPQRVLPVSGSGPPSEKHVQVGNSRSSKNVRAFEHIVLDVQGNKRRRLDLSALPPLQSESPVLGTLDLQQDKEWYMGPERILPSQLFYPFTADEDDRSFVMLGPSFPTGQRYFVKKCLDYFFKQQPIKLSSDKGGSQWAVVPYDHSKANDPGHRFFTLYTAKDGTVAITQENAQKWPQWSQTEARSPQSQQTLDPSDPYSYLLQKYPAAEEHQDVCPLYGDSGSEGEFDEETWLEITDERNELTLHKPTRLTSAEVDTVIEERMNEFVNKWRQNGLPKEEPKAWKLWQTSRRAKCTNQRIKAIAHDIGLLEKRLGKVLEAIRGSEYASKAELQTQCQSMEQTVLDIQKQKWRISVLGQDRCPPKVVESRKTKPLPKPKASLDDEESLHSESDMSSDPLDDFIDDSELDGQIASIEYVDQTPDERMIETDDRTSTPSTSDSDDDIISRSGIRRKSRARRPPFMASSSSSPLDPRNADQSMVIDLTMDTPSADELRIETPPLNPVRLGQVGLGETDLKIERTPSISPDPPLGSQVVVEIPRREVESSSHSPEGSKSTGKNNSPELPGQYDFVGLLSYPWDLLEERLDRRRLLAKLIASLPDEERENMALSIPAYEYGSLKDLTKKALRALRKGNERIPDIDQDDIDHDEIDRDVDQLAMRTASLFISWVNCVHLSMERISKRQIQRAHDEINGFDEFHNELYKGLQLCKGLQLSTGMSSKHSSDSEEEQSERGDAPHKKRKRGVKESKDVKQTQERAQLRVARQEEERKRLEQKMESMGVSDTDPTLQAVSFGEPIIYLDAHIGRRVKPHQVNGIQFMWRELIQDEKQQGCLLAHTMGLGKTMQVISFLTTISAAASSSDLNISQQVPACFHRSQTLILCPSSLIDNWYEEFLMWTPEESRIGPLRKVTAASTVSQRLQEVSDWDEEGGVLIMSYDIFRTWILNPETSKRPKPLRDEDHEKVRKWLLEDPNIIVADEAHKMKNPTSGISRAAMQFRSKSRIALTGSPLANNLVDYFTMVNWIAEGYLGDFVQFKANYVEPIEDGLYVDSSYYERRKSLKKLQVLKEILDPKVNRADVAVLQGSLPPKVEFVITIPLTELQQKAYDSYVESVFQGKGTEIGNARLWSWLAILGLCCNHPACFREKLLGRANDAQKAESKPEEMIPGDESITQAGLPDSERLVSQQEQLFASVPDMKVLNLSYRAQLLDRIISESIGAGDKVLIFSHSIPTLNYVEHILKTSNRSYCRLDGKTPMASRQAATKRFNTASEQQVYLISTRAGGLGLNIPGANRVVIFDFSFNPVWEEQAVGRAYRLGQQKPVFVYRFIAGGTFEEIMYNKAIFKTQLSFRVVDKKNPIRWASKKLNDYLFPVKPVQQQDVSEFLGKDPHVLDKIIREDNGEKRAIRKIDLTETFQKEDNDKLTEEERKDVQQELDDERLKRTNPQAYQRLLVQRQREAGMYGLPGPRSQPQGQIRAAKPPMPNRSTAAQQARGPPQGNPRARSMGPPVPPPNGSVQSQSGSTPNAASVVPQNAAANGSQGLRQAQSEPPRPETTAPSVPQGLPPKPQGPPSESPNPPDRVESGGSNSELEDMQVDGARDSKKDGGSCKTQ